MSDFSFSEKFLRDFDSVEPLGAGGMARVFRARQVALNRAVAIKVIHPDFFLFPESKDRFFREGKVTALLRHPNIVTLLAADEDNGQPYLVFELIEGETLRDVLARQTRFSARRALEIVRDIAAGLAEAHAQKIIHRDLKPDNVLIDKAERIKVADFGLARETDAGQHLTQKGILLGTPGYISPELIKGSDPSPQSDVYACGIILFELITGVLPFSAKSDKEMLLRHMREAIPSPTTKGVVVHTSVEQLLASAVASDPARRFRDGRALHRAICETLATLPESQAHTQALRVVSAKGVIPTHTRIDLPASTTLLGTLTRGLSARQRVAATVAIPVLLGVVVAALIVGGHRRAPAVQYALRGAPRTVAGVQSAHIEWETDRPGPSLLALWETIETDMRTVSPPSDPDSRELVSRHRMDLRGLNPDTTYHFRIVFADRSLSRDSFQLRTRPRDEKPLASDLTYMHHAGGSVEVRWKTALPLVSGLAITQSLPGMEQTTRCWDRHDPALEHSVLLAGLDPQSDAGVHVIFGELEDDKVDLGRIPGRDAIEALAHAAATLWPARAQDLANIVLKDLGELDKGESATRPPESWPEAPPKVRARVDDWCQSYMRIGLKQIGEDVPRLLADVGLPAAWRHKVYQAIAPLEVVDAIAALHMRRPILGIRALVAPYVTIRYPAEGPRGEHLLDVDPRKEFQKFRTEHTLMVPSRTFDDAGGAPNGQDTDLVANLSPVMLVPGEEFLRKSDLAYVTHWTMPAAAPGRALAVALRLANLSQEFWLEVVFDDTRSIDLRPSPQTRENVISTLRDSAGTSDTDLKNLQRDIREASIWVEARVPAELLAPGAHEVAIRMHNVSKEAGSHAVLHGCWLVDAVVGVQP